MTKILDSFEQLPRFQGVFLLSVHSLFLLTSEFIGNSLKQINAV